VLVSSLLRPIPPQTIFSMIEAGHDAGFILQFAGRGINGVYNSSNSPARERREDPAFNKLISAIQQADAIGMRTVPTGKGTAARVPARRGRRPRDPLCEIDAPHRRPGRRILARLRLEPQAE